VIGRKRPKRDEPEDFLAKYEVPEQYLSVDSGNENLEEFDAELSGIVINAKRENET